ncbi:hypothetical protein OAE69_02685 [Gammaproteobacteria bacterium]|nr:hypothetical protein [Gammaproteobacteria bacterium]
MKKISILLSIFLIQGCLISPTELEELNADNSFNSPVQIIKCMQLPSPQRPTPINKKGETREIYDQSDCYDELLKKDQRDLIIELKKPSIDLSKKDESVGSVNNPDDDFDIEAIEEKVLKKK